VAQFGVRPPSVEGRKIPQQNHSKSSAAYRLIRPMRFRVGVAVVAILLGLLFLADKPDDEIARSTYL
jgi:hypothetical protein